MGRIEYNTVVDNLNMNFVLFVHLFCYSALKLYILLHRLRQTLSHISVLLLALANCIIYDFDIFLICLNALLSLEVGTCSSKLDTSSDSHSGVLDDMPRPVHLLCLPWIGTLDVFAPLSVSTELVWRCFVLVSKAHFYQ